MSRREPPEDRQEDGLPDTGVEQKRSLSRLHSGSLPTPVELNTQPNNNEQNALPRWYPRWWKSGNPVYHGNVEAFGWAIDSVARSVQLIGAGAFLATALLKLAKESVGCETEIPEGENKPPECNERVYGLFRPSSLLTTYTMIVGVVSAALLPFMGAIVDYTPYRLQAGRWLSVVFCVMLFPQIFLNDNTWFAVALLQIGVAFSGWAQTMVTYAYLPELSGSQKRLNEYTQSFTIISFTSMLLYLTLIVGVSYSLDLGDVDTARVGQTVSFVISCALLYVSWFRLFKARPAAHSLPEGTTLWTAGFVQVYRTVKRISRSYKSLMWFYLSVAFIDAGVNSLVTITITYLTDTLLFTSEENGITIICVLLGSIPGGLIAGKSSHWKLNPIQSSILATSILLLNTIAAASFLHGPGQQLETYLIAGIWGLGSGWKWTIDRLLASTLIPMGQDAELMGLYLFSGQILTWLPPLLFTILNELGVSQQVGIGSMFFWFLLGLAALCMMGDYRSAVIEAGRQHILDSDDCVISTSPELQEAHSQPLETAADTTRCA